MSGDIVALLRNRPDIPTVVDGMIAFGELVEPRDAGEGVTHLHDPDGRLLVSIEAPALVQVPGEVERLLGPGLGIRVPVWWIDVRAASGLPSAARIARRFADDIVRWQGGVVWDGSPVDGTPPAQAVSDSPSAEDPAVGAPAADASDGPADESPVGEGRPVDAGEGRAMIAGEGQR